MTAPIGTVANLYNGIREFGQVTNSYGGYLTSAGAAYNLAIPFQADRFDWFRYTGFGSNTENIQGVWFRDFPATSSLIIQRGTTTLTSDLEVSNGITIDNIAGGFTAEQLVITNITTATPAVVTTSTNHNLSNNDRVVITKVIGTMASFINNTTYVVVVLSATTFSLYDTFGVPITTIGAYSSSGQVTKVGPLLGNVNQPVNPAYPQNAIINYPSTHQLTLGTAIMGASSDVIYFTAWKFNNYVNWGVV